MSKITSESIIVSEPKTYSKSRQEIIARAANDISANERSCNVKSWWAFAAVVATGAAGAIASAYSDALPLLIGITGGAISMLYIMIEDLRHDAATSKINKFKNAELKTLKAKALSPTSPFSLSPVGCMPMNVNPQNG